MTAFILAVIVNNYNTGQVSPNILFPFILSYLFSALCLHFDKSVLARIKAQPWTGKLKLKIALHYFCVD